MRHCENCGEELREGMKFCGNCGSPVPLEEPSEPEKPERNAPEPAGAGETRQSPGPTAPDGPQLGKWKKTVLGVAVVIVTLAVVAAVAWQSGIGQEPAEPATKEPTQAVNQDDLLGTLDWKEDQDKEYELKHSLIEGNPDSNVKEIFEESAYFIPKRHAYATDGDVAYYLIECEYDKDGKTVPYALVFQVNEDKHLELVDLHKNGKKVGKGKFDSFHKKLYTTKADLEAAEEAKAAAEEMANPFAYMEGLTYSFNPDEGDGIPEDVYIDDVAEDTIVLTMSSGISTMEHLCFYRVGPAGSAEYECHQYGKAIDLYIYDENSIGINFAEADGTDYGLTVYVR